MSRHDVEGFALMGKINVMSAMFFASSPWTDGVPSGRMGMEAQGASKPRGLVRLFASDQPGLNPQPSTLKASEFLKTEHLFAEVALLI
jgi:hypothetical protein